MRGDQGHFDEAAVLMNMMFFLGAGSGTLFSSGCVTHLYCIKKISRFTYCGLTPFEGWGSCVALLYCISVFSALSVQVPSIGFTEVSLKQLLSSPSQTHTSL
jgi:hypothetical protein